MPMARYKSRTRPFRVHLRENPVNDKEDSGVHLEEPSSPVSKTADDPGNMGRHSYIPRHGITITKISRPQSENSPVKSPTTRTSLPNRGSHPVRQYDTLTGKMVTLDLLDGAKSTRVNTRSSKPDSVVCSQVKKVPEPANVEEDEGLDVRGSNSDVCRGENSESSSTENSDAENDDQAGSSDGPKRIIHKTCSADAAMMAAVLPPCDPSDLVKSKQKSSLAKNVRKKFQKLRRRNTDSLLGAAILTVRGTTKITPADALEWGNSFESLLADKNGLELFRNFLKSEFSEENVEFWVACEEFKTTRTNKLVSRAQKIYSDYVAPKAPKQVNLDSKTRLETVTNLENPTRDMFKQAQKRIQFLMENDSYKRFLDSDTYKKLLTPPTGSVLR